MSFADPALPTLDEFAAQLYRTFQVRLGDAVFEAVLISANRTGSNDRITSYSLLFRAPIDAPREQRICRLENDELGGMDLFLVPVGATAEGLEYEAVINLVS